MKIVIESGIAPPDGLRRRTTGKCALLRAAIVAMRPGDSFLWPDHFLIYTAAQQVKAKIRTEKLDGAGYRVWRIK